VSNVEPGWQFASDNTAASAGSLVSLEAANVGYAPAMAMIVDRARLDLIRALFECPRHRYFSCSTARPPTR